MFDRAVDHIDSAVRRPVDCAGAYWPLRRTLGWAHPPEPVAHALRLVDALERRQPREAPDLARLDGWQSWWQAVEVVERRQNGRQQALESAYSRLREQEWPTPTPRLVEQLQTVVLGVPTALRTREARSRVTTVAVSGTRSQERRHAPLSQQDFRLILEQATHSSIHPLVRACRLYWDFVLLHPFDDGNGRAARLWLTALCHRERLPVPDLLTLYRYPKLTLDSTRPGAAPLTAERVWGLIAVAARTLTRCPVPPAPPLRPRLA